MTGHLLLTTELRYEQDVVLARQRTRQIASLVRLDPLDQTRFATAVSEIARNAFQYAGGGTVDFSLESDPSPYLVVRIRDRGPGIRDLRRVLDGEYNSRTGMGLGILGARRLSDRFAIESDPSGTCVELWRTLPQAVTLDAGYVDRIGAELKDRPPRSPADELQQQNQELLRILEALRNRQAEIERLNLELEETNRGVLALYAELDERAGYLARANDMKTRFLSHLSHELRTPLNAIQNLSRLLLEGIDGPLTERQQRPVQLIGKSAGELTELVSDWLDLAKIEAGKVEVKVVSFQVSEVIGTLRGLFRPISAPDSATLVFADVADFVLNTDEQKVAQILRNFISNALKFTRRGEVWVGTNLGADGLARFVVRDTGVGIGPEDQERIFEEFSQVHDAIGQRVRGSGLGLPLSRQLARLLGGDISVESTPGVGSTFTLTIPNDYSTVAMNDASSISATPSALTGSTRDESNA